MTRVDREEETTAVNTKALSENVTGEFNVTLTSQASPVFDRRIFRSVGNFTLDIPILNGLINGTVIFYQTKFADPCDRDIPRCDFNQDHVVNILDMAQVAKAFEAKYGDSKYDPDFDLDGKKIDRSVKTPFQQNTTT